MIIETFNLTKLYGGRLGCRDICLSVPEGQIFGFLGPNGAGKSTLVKTLVGLIFPTSGTARLLGRPLGDLKAREKIGFLPENFRYQSWLTGYEVLSYHGSLCKLPERKKKARIEEVLAMVGLAGREGHRVGTYSKGMQQRLGLAVALVADPDLLFLDEPTSALDPLGRKEVRELILALKRQGKTVFLNSHLLSEVEMICDRVAIIKKGRIIASGTMAELNSGRIEVEARVDGFNEDIHRKLREQGFDFSFDGECLTATLRNEEEIPGLAGAIVSNGGRLYQLVPRRQSLESLFINLVQEREE
ncbi:ABC transporter ATP-binding protein [Desulfofundulus sp. TPOSR]|nr:ABC transporter ATP-binding protein [Desulfofundulus sp. TPOSR]